MARKTVFQLTAVLTRLHNDYAGIQSYGFLVDECSGEVDAVADLLAEGRTFAARQTASSVVRDVL